MKIPGETFAPGAKIGSADVNNCLKAALSTNIDVESSLPHKGRNLAWKNSIDTNTIDPFRYMLFASVPLEPVRLFLSLGKLSQWKKKLDKNKHMFK